jgi:hypothetical protein
MKILYIPIFILFIISCTGPEAPTNPKGSRGETGNKIQGAGDPGIEQKDPVAGTYVPGQILVKFKENTLKETVSEIQKTLHLKTVRIVSPPSLYLMEITDDTPVEKIIREIKKYDVLEYAEPNYIRKIN